MTERRIFSNFYINSLKRYASIILLGFIGWLFLDWYRDVIPYSLYKLIAEASFLEILVVSIAQGFLIFHLKVKFHVKLINKKPLIKGLAQFLTYPSIGVLFFLPYAYIAVQNGSFIDALIATPLGLNTLIILFSYSVFHCLNQKKPLLTVPKASYLTAEDLLKNTDYFLSWLKSEEPADVDLLNRNHYIQRIVNRINPTPEHSSLEESNNKVGRGQAIIGDYGTGKSTLVKNVTAELQAKSDNLWIISTFSSWGRASNKHKIIHQILEQVINDIGKEVEATSLSSIPDSYITSAYNISSWFNILQAIQINKAPEEILSKINDVLHIHNKKLLIVIEDLDRAGNDEEIANDVSGLFDRLGLLENIHFIFTIGDISSKVTEAIPRIVDAVEELTSEDVDDILYNFYLLCKNGFDSILPYENNFNNDWSLRFNERSGTYQEILDFLSNPRELKLILRRVYSAWEVIHGEVNFNDLLIFNILRRSSNESHIKIYKELIRHDEARRYKENRAVKLAAKLIDSNNEKEDQDNKTEIEKFFLCDPGYDYSLSQKIIKNKKYLSAASKEVTSEKTDQVRICLVKDFLEGNMINFDKANFLSNAFTKDSYIEEACFRNYSNISKHIPEEIIIADIIKYIPLPIKSDQLGEKVINFEIFDYFNTAMVSIFSSVRSDNEILLETILNNSINRSIPDFLKALIMLISPEKQCSLLLHSDQLAKMVQKVVVINLDTTEWSQLVHKNTFGSLVSLNSLNSKLINELYFREAVKLKPIEAMKASIKYIESLYIIWEQGRGGVPFDKAIINCDLNDITQVLKYYQLSQNIVDSLIVKSVSSDVLESTDKDVLHFSKLLSELDTAFS